jgi:hypothetical protein
MVNVGPFTAPETFEFAENYWYCYDDALGGPPALPVAEKDPAGGLDPHFRDPSKGDLRAAAGSPARVFGAEAFASAK